MAKTCVNFTAAQVLAALRGEAVTVREAVKADLGGLIWCGWIIDSTTNNDMGKACWVDQYPLSTKEVRVNPPYIAGNTLWVRETHMDYHDNGGTGYWYKATEKGFSLHIISVFGRWKSPVTMPRWASRLNVTVQSVAVEQVASGWEWVAEMVKAVQE